MYSDEELERERQIRTIQNESIINRLTRENLELELEIAKLKMELKKLEE